MEKETGVKKREMGQNVKNLMLNFMITFEGFDGCWQYQHDSEMFIYDESPILKAALINIIT